MNNEIRRLIKRAAKNNFGTFEGLSLYKSANYELFCYRKYHGNDCNVNVTVYEKNKNTLLGTLIGRVLFIINLKEINDNYDAPRKYELLEIKNRKQIENILGMNCE